MFPDTKWLFKPCLLIVDFYSILHFQSCQLFIYLHWTISHNLINSYFFNTSKGILATICCLYFSLLVNEFFYYPMFYLCSCMINIVDFLVVYQLSISNSILISFFSPAILTIHYIFSYVYDVTCYCWQDMVMGHTTS